MAITEKEGASQKRKREDTPPAAQDDDRWPPMSEKAIKSAVDYLFEVAISTTLELGCTIAAMRIATKTPSGRRVQHCSISKNSNVERAGCRHD